MNTEALSLQTLLQIITPYLTLLITIIIGVVGFLFKRNLDQFDAKFVKIDERQDDMEQNYINRFESLEKLITATFKEIKLEIKEDSTKFVDNNTCHILNAHLLEDMKLLRTTIDKIESKVDRLLGRNVEQN